MIFALNQPARIVARRHVTEPHVAREGAEERDPVSDEDGDARDDETLDTLKSFRSAEDAIDIAKYDDAGNYRPLKTSPDLRHGWRLELDSVEELRRALDYFYPACNPIRRSWTAAICEQLPA